MGVRAFVIFLYHKVDTFLFRFWILGKVVFVEGRMKYLTVVLILIKLKNGLILTVSKFSIFSKVLNVFAPFFPKESSTSFFRKKKTLSTLTFGYPSKHENVLKTYVVPSILPGHHTFSLSVSFSCELHGSIECPLLNQWRHTLLPRRQ